MSGKPADDIENIRKLAKQQKYNLVGDLEFHGTDLASKGGILNNLN